MDMDRLRLVAAVAAAPGAASLAAAAPLPDDDGWYEQAHRSAAAVVVRILPALSPADIGAALSGRPGSRLLFGSEQDEAVDRLLLGAANALASRASARARRPGRLRRALVRWAVRVLRSATPAELLCATADERADGFEAARRLLATHHRAFVERVLDGLGGAVPLAAKASPRT